MGSSREKMIGSAWSYAIPEPGHCVNDEACWRNVRMANGYVVTDAETRHRERQQVGRAKEGQGREGYPLATCGGCFSSGDLASSHPSH